MSENDKNETAKKCPTCNALLTDDVCLNVGICLAADVAASRSGTGDTVKSYRSAPAAWTISGGVD